jgi:hypothetical protein
VVGNVTGDVTGTLTGDVVGNVTGDVTGTLTGDITGPTTLTGLLTVTDEIVYGANALYPVGAGLPGFQIGGARVEITGTHVYTHATGIPWVVLCAMELPTMGALLCGIERGAQAVTVTVYSAPPTLTVASVPAWVNILILGEPTP